MMQPVAHELHHAAAGLANRACDAQKFVGAGPQGGDCLAADAAVVDGARGGKAERAGLNGLTGDGRHLLDVFRGGWRSRHAARAHHIHTHRRMRQLGAEVDVARQGLEKIEVFGEGLPLPGQSFVQRGAGNVLDAFHQFDQAIVIA